MLCNIKGSIISCCNKNLFIQYILNACIIFMKTKKLFYLIIWIAFIKLFMWWYLFINMKKEMPLNITVDFWLFDLIYFFVLYYFPLILLLTINILKFVLYIIEKIICIIILLPFVTLYYNCKTNPMIPDCAIIYRYKSKNKKKTLKSFS